MVKETKFYDILGVAPDADENALKRAYRSKAMSCHPDKFQDPTEKSQAEEKFKMLSRAFEVLSNRETRARYDARGEAGLEGTGGGDHDPSDIFSSLFGFGGGGGRGRGERKPKDILHQLEIPLEDFYCGKTRKLAIQRTRLCSACAGSGSKVKGMSAVCADCRGKGAKMLVQQIAPGFVQQMQVACSTCKGKGTNLPDHQRCSVCHGEQAMQVKNVFEINVDKGMKNEDFVRLTGEGDQVPGIEKAGDIVIVFKEKEHPIFKRRNNALIMDMTIPLAEALCGFHTTITHLDGSKIVVSTPAGMCIKPPPHLFIVPREGMPKKGTGGSEKGDLIINFTIRFPLTLTPAQQDDILKVLGSKRVEKPQIGDDISYETSIVESAVQSIDSLCGKDSDDEEDGSGGARGGGPTVACAQQ